MWLQAVRSCWISSCRQMCALLFSRWAQFFICPLMLEDAVDREVEAVDSGESAAVPSQILLFINHNWCSSSSSEFQLARPSDSHRKETLFGSLSKAGHPMGKFFWGESSTRARAAGTDSLSSWSTEKFHLHASFCHTILLCFSSKVIKCVFMKNQMFKRQKEAWRRSQSSQLRVASFR